MTEYSYRQAQAVQRSISSDAARLKAIDAEMEALHLKPNLSAVDEERFHELEREFDAVDNRIRAAKTGEIEFESGTRGDEPDLSAAYFRGSDTAPLEIGAGESATRSVAMRQIDHAVRSGMLPEHAAERVENLIDRSGIANSRATARWAATTGDPAYLGAWSKLLMDPDRGHLRWTGEEHAAFQRVQAYQDEQRAAMSLTDSAGGYLVPMTLDPTILLTSAGSVNPMRQICRVVQTATDTWSGITSAGTTGEWKAEGSQAAEATVTLGQPNIPVHFGSVFTPFSYEIGMDGLNFVNEVSKVLADAYDQLQAAAFATGSGTGQPTGIVTALAGTASEVAPTTGETFAAADIYKLDNALPSRFQPNSSWMGNRAILNLTEQFETTNGALKFPELRESPPRLVRRPVYENSSMDGTYDAAATANNYVLIVGQFENYVIVDRIGTQVDLHPYLYGANGRPTGQRGIHLWGRTGGDTVVDNAFRMLNVATTA